MNLIAAAIIGIAIIVLLIAVCKVHPFLSLLKNGELAWQ